MSPSVKSLTLSVHHRPIDGVVAAEGMAAFVSLLEEKSGGFSSDSTQHSSRD